MRRTLVAVLIMMAASAVIASDAIFQLSGWAEIPSTYRHPGPVSGQFTSPNNGVTPPYNGQPIPGFSGMIPAPTPGSFFALPDNGFGAQGNSADFVIGFYEVTPSFKAAGDGTTTPGPVILVWVAFVVVMLFAADSPDLRWTRLSDVVFPVVKIVHEHYPAATATPAPRGNGQVKDVTAPHQLPRGSE